MSKEELEGMKMQSRVRRGSSEGEGRGETEPGVRVREKNHE